MKNFFLILLSILLQLNLFSQKVDIDNTNIEISNSSLPLNFIDPGKRTYNVVLSGNSNYTGIDKAEAIKLSGWQKLNPGEEATLEVIVNVGNFAFGNPNSSSRVEERKDKDGKVTGRTTYYKTSVSNWSQGSVQVKGLKNELPPKTKKEPEKESKSDKKKKEKEKELAANPFLKDIDLTEAKSPQSETEKSEVYTYSLNKEYSYSSGEHSSASAAYKVYSDNIGRIRNDHENDFRNNYTKWITNFINGKYGYYPVNNYVRFKKLDSKKHPEFDMFDAALSATREIFKKMRYNKNISEIRNDLIPILKYFDEVVKKYPGDDKDFEKLRGAALYNQIRIHQYLDNHDKAIELTASLELCGKKNEKAAGKFVDESQLLKEKLAFHKMVSRHLPTTTYEEGKDNLGEKVEEAGEDDN